MIPEPIQRFIEAFSRLPSIGPRMATRLAFHIRTLPKETVLRLETALHNLLMIDPCPQCFFLKDSGKPLCSFCLDPQRDSTTILILEKETDLLSFEKAKQFHGRYFIFGDLMERGALSQTHTVRLQHLIVHIREKLNGKAQEIIIGLPPNSFGDFASEMLQNELAPYAERISRLARGIPTGGDIEFADEDTLRNAIRNRS